MDFNALQHKLFALDPSDPAEDLRKLAESAGGMPQENAPITESLVQESVEVQEGTMPVEGDYSLNDFAALAGVTLNEDWRDAAKRGWDNHNSMDAIGLGKDSITKAAGFGPGGKKDKKEKPATKYPVAQTNDYDYKNFLKQHTVGLKAIAADPKKKKEFDAFMTKMGENIEEENKGLYHNVNKRKKAGTSRKQGHPKAPTAQAWKDAAKTAKKESVESIKDMLYRKLNDKK